MNKRTTIDGMAKAIEDELEAFTYDAQEATVAAVNETATEALKVVKAKAKAYGWSGGPYYKALKAKKAGVGLDITAYVYAEAPHYRLVHLLEHGHLAVNGRMVKARPHFEAGQEFVDENIERIFKEKFK